MKSWFLSGDALIDSIRSLSLPDNCCAIWPIGQVGFFLKYRSTTILIDPVLTPITDDNGKSCLHFEAPFAPEASFPVDAIFCTHNHLDHLNPDTISRIAASHPSARFYIPKAVMKDTEAIFAPYADRVTGITQGDTLATHRLAEEVCQYGPISLALLPINGRDWLREKNLIGNMSPLEAVLFAEQISSRMVIPTHYDMFIGNEEDPMIFAQYMRMKTPDRPFHIPLLGEPFILYQ